MSAISQSQCIAHVLLSSNTMKIKSSPSSSNTHTKKMALLTPGDAQLTIVFKGPRGE